MAIKETEKEALDKLVAALAKILKPKEEGEEREGGKGIPKKT